MVRARKKNWTGNVIPWLLLNTVTRTRWSRFSAQNRALRATQEALLLGMVTRAADTAFGRAHGFAAIRSRADFQNAIPIGTWDDFSPYVDRVVEGETGVLTNEPPPAMFNRTSGTTGKAKLIPVGPATTRGNLLTQKLWAFKAIERHPGFLNGKAIPMVNKAVEGVTEKTKTPYGSVSGAMFRDAHPIARGRYAYPYDVVEIPDYRARRYALMRLAVPKNVTFIPGSNPNSILKLFEVAEEAKAELVKDVFDGTLSPAFDIPDAQRSALAPQLKPDPSRARALEKIASAGAFRPRDYWPGLKLIGCWKGGTVGQFAAQLHDWCAPGLVLRDTGYMSSEAHITIPVTDEGSDGLLTIHTNVFEFVPEAEWGQPDARALFADEIEVGQAYYILLTTPSGLYRYAINDVVEVTGRFDGAPLIRFLRKGRDVINIHGEKVSANQVIGAMAAAAAQTGCKIRHFTVVPDITHSRYALHVEFDGPAPGEAGLPGAFDQHLGALNYLFKGARSVGTLAPTLLRVMREGWFDAVTNASMAAGMRDTQFKPQVLADTPPSPEYFERGVSAVH
jgi:hypothetical protein